MRRVAAYGLPSALIVLPSQGKVVRRLAASLGPGVGYMAGLTNPAMQKRFGAEHPVRGVLLRDMLLQSGAEVPVRFE